MMSDSGVVALHRQLVQIPSLSSEEGPLADTLEAYFSTAGVGTRRIGNSIVASIGNGPKTLLLNTHLDTVPPSSHHPHGDFDAVIHDNHIWGRGTVDAKASLACMSYAMAKLAIEGWVPEKGRLLGAFTTCEETGGEDNGLEQVLPELGHIHAALVGEPTEMQPCIAQKGLLILRLESNGVSAHAARPEGGVNAISKAAVDILALENLTFDRVHKELGAVTLQVTTIEGGTARNVIPDGCTFFVDIRSTPSYSHDELVALVADAVRSHVHIHSDRFVPVATDSEHLIVQLCLGANEGARVFGSPTMSDWIHLTDIPTVKIGPGDSRLSHTSEERISITALARATEIYRDIILRYFDSAHEG